MSDVDPNPIPPDVRRINQLIRDGSPIWCVAEDEPAIASCTFAGHKMIEEDKNVHEETPKPIPPPFIAILRELADERRRQREQHGWTADHDDNLTNANWAWLLQQRVTTVLAPTIRPSDMRRCLVELAAISTAAVEALDRSEKRQGF